MSFLNGISLLPFRWILYSINSCTSSASKFSHITNSSLPACYWTNVSEWSAQLPVCPCAIPCPTATCLSWNNAMYNCWVDLLTSTGSSLSASTEWVFNRHANAYFKYEHIYYDLVVIHPRFSTDNNNRLSNISRLIKLHDSRLGCGFP